MINYQKPTIEVFQNLCSEGIYAFSGGTNDTGSSRRCQSKYMNGVYHSMQYTGGPDITKRGCEGCNANWGFCAIKFCNYDGVFKPSWE